MQFAGEISVGYGMKAVCYRIIRVETALDRYLKATRPLLFLSAKAAEPTNPQYLYMLEDDDLQPLTHKKGRNQKKFVVPEGLKASKNFSPFFDRRLHRELRSVLYKAAFNVKHCDDKTQRTPKPSDEGTSVDPPKEMFTTESLNKSVQTPNNNISLSKRSTTNRIQTRQTARAPARNTGQERLDACPAEVTPSSPPYFTAQEKPIVHQTEEISSVPPLSFTVKEEPDAYPPEDMTSSAPNFLYKDEQEQPDMYPPEDISSNLSSLENITAATTVPEIKFDEVTIPSIHEDDLDIVMNEGQMWKLGEGVAGTVYLGKLRSRQNELVVVKTYGGATGTALQEAKIQSYVATTGYAPKVFGHLQYATLLPDNAIVQEYTGSAQTALRLLRARYFYTEIQWVEAVLKMAVGLKEIHKLGVLHNDIKADNVLIFDSDDGLEVRFIDFGMATVNEGFQCGASKEHLATCIHYSPEFRDQQPTTVKSDIYNFGFMIGQISQFAVPCLSSLSVECMYQNPAERPSLDEIISYLDQLLSFWREEDEQIRANESDDDDDEDCWGPGYIG